MGIGNIVAGHWNEMMNNNEDMATTRMEICKRCPLLKMTEAWGPICNPDLYLNTETMEATDRPVEDYGRGCGCRLNAKTRDKQSHCPNKLW